MNINPAASCCRIRFEVFLGVFSITRLGSIGPSSAALPNFLCDHNETYRYGERAPGCLYDQHLIADPLVISLQSLRIY